MLNLIAGGIPASVEFYRRLRDHRAGGRRRPACAGHRAGHPLYHSRALLGHEYQFGLDTAEGQLFLNRRLTSLQRTLGRQGFRHQQGPQARTWPLQVLTDAWHGN
jgi:hypothetical protein